MDNQRHRTPLRHRLPHRLRDTRLARGYSQEALATLAGLPPSSICHYERGDRLPALPQLWLLADALGVSTDYLLGREDVDQQGTHISLAGFERREVRLIYALLAALRTEEALEDA